MSFLVNFLSDDGDSDVEYYTEELNKHHKYMKKTVPVDTNQLNVSMCLV